MSGKSLRRCAPRLSWRASADAATSRASGWGSSRSWREALGVALEPGAAPHGLAGFARGQGDVGRSGRAGHAGRRRLVEPGRGGAAAEHEALAERVRGEPVGAVEAGAGALADRVEARDGGAAVEVGGDAAHHVVAAGETGTSSRHRVEAGLAERVDDVGEAPGVDVAHVEVDVGLAGRVHRRADGAGDCVAGRELVDEALAGRRRAGWRPRRGRPRRRGSPRGAARRSPRWGGTGRTRGRRASAPAARASSRPEPNEPGGLVVRDHSAAAPPVARITARAASVRPSSVSSPVARASVSRRPSARRLSRTSMLGCSDTAALSSRRIRRPVALPPAWATRRREWPPSSPSARLPWRSASKRTPSRSRSRKRAGASSARMRAAEVRTIPRPAARVSCRCSSGESSSASAAASPPCAQ